VEEEAGNSLTPPAPGLTTLTEAVAWAVFVLTVLMVLTEAAARWGGEYKRGGAGEERHIVGREEDDEDEEEAATVAGLPPKELRFTHRDRGTSEEE